MHPDFLVFPYKLILRLRHFLYDKGIRKSVSAGVPTICVGNITVGGTGKTPHTEMILRMLLSDSRFGGTHIAVLSRGYKRRLDKTMFRYADHDPILISIQLGDK